MTTVLLTLGVLALLLWLVLRSRATVLPGEVAY
jgi:hypothetical protein